MSLETRIGAEGNMLEEGHEHARQLVLEHPVLDNDQLERIARSGHASIRPAMIDATWPVADGATGIAAALAPDLRARPTRRSPTGRRCW